MKDMDIKAAVAVTTHDLAGLHLKFVVPLAVGDMLQGREMLDDVAEYTLHDVVGALEPDTALLCLALCAQNIAAHAAHLPAAQMLAQQADQIVEEYGPVWLAYESGLEGPDKTELRRMLYNIPEDLECLGDLLLAIGGEMDESHAVAAILCDILSEQAHMHKEMADERIESLRPARRKAATDKTQASNVIAFPAR